MRIDFPKQKKVLRSLQGFILSLGSPLGWIAIQMLFGVDPIVDIRENVGIYVYMTVGTAIAFSVFGFYVGSYEGRVEALALIDPLTGLYNNRYFHERLHQEFSLAVRNRESLSVVLFDLDHFKRINDEYGHLVGDQILKEVSKNMRQCSREGETIARVGGEEICVILPDCPEKKAVQVAERFCTAIRSTSGTYRDGVQVNVSASAGVATLFAPDHKGNEWDLYAMADKAMYAAKANGRNRVVFLRQGEVAP